MAYIAKIKRGSDYIVTSSSETVEGCLEALMTFISGEKGDIAGFSIEDVEVEYTDIPYVFSAHRNWRGELLRVYGFTLERAKEIMEKGGYGSLHLAYSKAFNPKTPIEEKAKIFGFSNNKRGRKYVPKEAVEYSPHVPDINSRQPQS